MVVNLPRQRQQQSRHSGPTPRDSTGHFDKRNSNDSNVQLEVRDTELGHYKNTALCNVEVWGIAGGMKKKGVLQEAF